VNARLIVKFDGARLAAVGRTDEICVVSLELDRFLQAEQLGAIESGTSPDIVTAVVVPAEAIGRALEAARSLLKLHKLKREASLDFEIAAPQSFEADPNLTNGTDAA